MTDSAETPIGAQAFQPFVFSTAVDGERDAVELAPRGELDLATVGRFQRELGRLIDAGSARIAIDLRGVEFLDSTALHALVTAYARARQGDWELTIIPGPPAVQRIFEVTRTIDRLPFTSANGSATAPEGRE